jgi:two-component system chemotaxis response regulator CheY
VPRYLKTTAWVVLVYRNLAFGRTLDSLDVALIDENQGMRSILTTVLKANGIARIRGFGDANQALSGMLERVPDVVLSQWTLQGSDAETMIRTMRTEAMRPLCFVPVIVLTANVSRSVIAEVLDAGASTLLRTPVSPKTLVERLQWTTRDGRAFVCETGQYVLQSPGDAAAVPGVDPGYGLMDLDLICETGPGA